MRALAAGLRAATVAAVVLGSLSSALAYDEKQFHYFQNKEIECNQTCHDQLDLVVNKNKACNGAHTPGISDETKDKRFLACQAKYEREFYACSHECNVKFCGPTHGYNPCRPPHKM